MVPTPRLRKRMGTPLRAAPSRLRFHRERRDAYVSFRTQRRRASGHPLLSLGPRRLSDCARFPSQSQRAALGPRNRIARPGWQPPAHRNRESMTKPKRILSGMRPTGRLHLGHFFGALSNWLKLQQEYDCYFFVADWHALTTHYEDTSSIAENTLQVAMDWLSIGLDPKKSTLFIQSQILEHAELHLLLSMITPLSWLERVPTYKEQIENLKDRDLGTYGFLGYPLLQSADIVIYDADFVPVGEDQVPHVELTREVVRRFNTNFGIWIKPILREKGAHQARTDIAKAFKAPDLRVPVEESPLSDAAWSSWQTSFRRRVFEIGIENASHLLRSVGGLEGYFMVRDILVEPGHLLTQ